MKKTLTLCCLLLSGCGFHPVYGPSENGTVTHNMGMVAIDSLPDRHGQMLRNDLIDRMYINGRPEHPLYRLTIKARASEEDLGIQADATSTRSMLNFYADYDLKDLKGVSLAHGTAHSVASFNKLTAQYATMAARDSAYERTISEVSNQIVNRLSVTFAEKNEKPATP